MQNTDQSLNYQTREIQMYTLWICNGFNQRGQLLISIGLENSLAPNRGTRQWNRINYLQLEIQRQQNTTKQKIFWWICSMSLWWRHNNYDSVSNHQPHECLLNRLIRRRSKKTSKLRVTGLCVGNSPGPVNSPHKGPVTRKMFPFDDVIMCMNFWSFFLQAHNLRIYPYNWSM